MPFVQPEFLSYILVRMRSLSKHRSSFSHSFRHTQKRIQILITMVLALSKEVAALSKTIERPFKKREDPLDNARITIIPQGFYNRNVSNSICTRMEYSNHVNRVTTRKPGS